jgi:hypothetical protein
MIEKFDQQVQVYLDGQQRSEASNRTDYDSIW